MCAELLYCRIAEPTKVSRGVDRAAVGLSSFIVGTHD